MLMIGAGDIACTASPCPATIQRFMHRGEHITVLPHAKIIIGTPDSNLAPNTLVMPNSAGEFTAAAFKIGENEWADTSMVADDVQVKFKLALTGVPKI